MNHFSFGKLKENFPSGVVVFLVALPLCLGIALASGAPPLSGIISGIIGGIVIGLVSNSHLSVSGPAAGLTAIVLTAIASLGSFELFLTAVVLSGIIQLLLGFAKAGGISNYFPNSVIEGMLAGIGVIIVLKQIPHAVGFDKDYEGNLSLFNSGYSISAVTDSIQGIISEFSFGALLITIISLAIMLLWEKVNVLKKLKLLPGALVAVVVSIILNEIFIQTQSSLQIQNEHLVNLPVLKSISDFGNLITFPDVAGLTNAEVWKNAFLIAIVASIETLLCIEAADRLDVKRRVTDTNLELKAQGIGNIISGMIGGLPMTSVVVRTSANANSGATHKTSAIIHGVLLLICVLSIPFVLNKIPLANLAAVLLLVGYKLANPEKVKRFYTKGIYQFLPFIITVISVVVSNNLLVGVGIGLAFSILFVLFGNMRRAYHYSKEELADADEITIKLAEEVSFLNKAAIKKTLYNINPNSNLIIDARRTSFINMDVQELIQDFANNKAKEDNIKVKFIGFKTSYQEYDSDEHSHVEIKHRRVM